VLGFDPERTFTVENEVLRRARAVADRGREAHTEWERGFTAWREANPDRAALLHRLHVQELPDS
jgi:transketolase